MRLCDLSGYAERDSTYMRRSIGKVMLLNPKSVLETKKPRPDQIGTAEMVMKQKTGKKEH